MILIASCTSLQYDSGPKRPYRYRSGLSMFKIRFQGLEVVLEGIKAGRGNPADRAGLAAFECLFDGDISRIGQVVDLHAQITCCRSCGFSKIDKVSLFEIDQHGHYCQAQFVMKQWIEFLEHIFSF